MGLAQESYVLSPESTLTIAGTSALHDWEVTANTIKGNMLVADETFGDLKIEVPAAEIKSDRGVTMDKKMYDALRAKEHPSVRFSADKFDKNGPVKGILSIAGVEKEIEVATKFVQGNGKMNVSGTQEIVPKDYEMEPPTAMFGQIVVGDMVVVKFDLIFSRE